LTRQLRACHPSIVLESREKTPIEIVELSSGRSLRLPHACGPSGFRHSQALLPALLHVRARQGYTLF
jgi:hypothetical protein